MVDISSLDLHYIIQELKILEGARIDKIVQPSKEDVFFQFYITGKGKKLLRINIPSGFYLTDNAPETPEKLLGFCSALRKYLSNARLDKISQEGSERIVKLVFKTKEEEYYIFVELFSKGNMVLCKKDMTIIVPVIFSKSKDRVVKPGVKYDYTKKEVDFFKLDLNVLKNQIKKEKKPISKVVAVNLGLGGVYSKEVCMLSGVDEDDTDIDDENLKKLLKSIKSIIAKKINPVLYYSNGLLKSAVPFELEIYKDLEKKNEKTFNSAVKTVYESNTKKKITKIQKDMAKIEKIISMQEKKIKEFENSVDENTKKGELIYEKYQLITEVLEEIKKAREKHSWKEIREKLKGHKLIKDVNEKTGEISVEI